MLKPLPILQNFLIEELRNHRIPVKDENDILLHLSEELGELSRAVRSKKSQEAIAEEVADIVWHLMRLCERKKINLEEIVLHKISQNEKKRDWHGTQHKWQVIDDYGFL